MSVITKSLNGKGENLRDKNLNKRDKENSDSTEDPCIYIKLYNLQLPSYLYLFRTLDSDFCSRSSQDG